MRATTIRSGFGRMFGTALQVNSKTGAVNGLRKVGRWLMNSPRRRRLFDALTRIAVRALGGRIRRGPAKGLRFQGGDTAGYLLGASEPHTQRVLVDYLRPGDVFFDI